MSIVPETMYLKKLLTAGTDLGDGFNLSNSKHLVFLYEIAFYIKFGIKGVI